MQRLRRARRACPVFASASVATKTVKIGTRGSPLALAQAYMTRDLLKVNISSHLVFYAV
jgi:hydroxymethylbilane synthase